VPDPSAVKADLAAVIRPMVDEPEAVQITAVPMRRATIFEVTTAQGDLGKIIGRKGRIARALRALLDCRGEADEAQYGIDILDE